MSSLRRRRPITTAVAFRYMCRDFTWLGLSPPDKTTSQTHGPGSRPGRRRVVLHLLLFLRLVPQCIHLIERRRFERASLRRQRALDVGEAAFEFGVGAAQRRFGIGAGMSCQADQLDQHIAIFVAELVGIASVSRG